ncbi:MAG: hypothetical protein ACKOSQ_04115 [Planctomycetaceae bacterium]
MPQGARSASDGIGMSGLSTACYTLLRVRRILLRWRWYAWHLLARARHPVVTVPPADPPRYRRAICLLTEIPDTTQIEFLRGIPGYDLLVICDDNTYDLTLLRASCRDTVFVQVDELRCLRAGYRQLNAVVKFGVPSAWDKAMYFLGDIISDRYEHVWFLESDVLVPAIDTIPAIDAKYGEGPDLLSGTVSSYADMPDWYFWSKHHDSSLPRVRCQASAIRVSRSLIGRVRSYAAKQGRLIFLESFLPSLAVRDGLRCEDIPELDTVQYHARWDPAAVQRSNLYHPVKQLTEHQDAQRRFGPRLGRDGPAPHQ